MSRPTSQALFAHRPRPSCSSVKRQIDGIPREPIGSGRDHRRDRLPRANRCPRPAKLADRKREQRHREQNQPSAYRLDGGRYHSRRPDGVEPEARQDGYQVGYRWSGKKDNASVIPRVLSFIGLRLRTVLPFIHDCHDVCEGSQRALSPKPATTWIAVSEQGCGDVAPAHVCRGCFDSGSLVGLGIHPREDDRI